MADMKKIVESLSPNERLIVPHLGDSGNMMELSEKSDLDKTSTLRSLNLLSNKGAVEVSSKDEKSVELGINGLLYVKNGLPERRLANLVVDKKSVSMKDAIKGSKLSDNEFKAALGVLKRKALIDLKDGNLVLNGTKEELSKKSLEESFLETLPRGLDSMEPEEKFAFENLKSRKNIIDIQERKVVEYNVTNLGKKLMKEKLGEKMIESVTSNLISSGNWKGKKFRRYDITSPVPKIHGGKRHFVNQAVEFGKRIWLDMGFKEMSGDYCQPGFWNFDALFTAQDHPVREMQDTFFIADKGTASKDAAGHMGKLPEKEVVEGIRKAHEGGIEGSKGWQDQWNEEKGKQVSLRTHTTCLSARTLLEIGKNKEFPAKYFALGKCFRNETVDWSHGFEFNQTEGIVVDENANFRQLLGYLIEFFKKMGYEKIKIRPGYFPYTEPSLEIDVFHPVHKKWVELGGAGMFRPEVTIPMFGRHIPVLAWGPGFDRIIMEFFEINDLRDMYKNDLNKLRDMKVWDR